MEIKRGMERGITREVVLIGRYAFKLPSVRSWYLFLEGLQCNMNEKDREKCSEHFCPISFYVLGGFLLVMRRCQPLPEYDYDEMRKAFYGPEEAKGSYVHNYVENKRCSFGLLDGRLVAVDYGS